MSDRIFYVADRAGFLQWLVREARWQYGAIDTEPTLRKGPSVAGPYITRGIAWRTADDMNREVERARAVVEAEQTRNLYRGGAPLR